MVRSIQFHKKLSGQPHIVKLVDTIENNKAFYFVMEYCELDLSKIIRDKGKSEFTKAPSAKK
jgi:serine/threonine protein kinase